jgi:hypothetical protein
LKQRKHKGSWALAAAASIVVALLLSAPAQAASPPLILATYVSDVTSTSVFFHAEVNPGGADTTCHFEYLTEADYQANLEASPSGDGFSGAARAPLKKDLSAGSGSTTVEVAPIESVNRLSSVTTYRYRVVASNSEGTTNGPDRSFTTKEPTNVSLPLDGRGWEMVSPVDKGGGAIQAPEAIFGGGVFQAAADGNALTYSSADSFGAGPQGAPAGSQYLATRGAGGWLTQNITTPLFSGSYGDSPDGVPYQLFSADLSRGLLSNGQRCRGPDGECPVANPPLPGTGAPAGYRDYYLRDNLAAGFQTLLDGSDLGNTALGPSQFELVFAAATPDLGHVVLSSCAALTPDAAEVAAEGGCDPSAQNLYEWSGPGLKLVNLTPGAAIAAPNGAISADGSRVYFTVAGALYLREGAEVRQVDEVQGGGGVFQTASGGGRFAFFTADEHLYRYDAVSDGATDLTPGGEVQGVLGAAADGSVVYYLSASGLFRWSGGTTTEVAAAAAASDYPPVTGTARVTPDGSHLAFLSAADLTGNENIGFTQVFLYGPPPGGGAAKLTCVSCSPTGERSEGASSIPGAVANGTATRIYKPRSLSDDGHRVFFDSREILVQQDGNANTDVYEWEAQGAGSCAREGGCVALISDGGDTPATFVDASANGSDAFFLTDSSLVFGDPGSFDLYDARVGGGFPAPPNVIPCNGDACQSLPEAPEDPTPGTLVPNSGNPAPRFPKRHRHKHRKRHRQGKHRKHRSGR